MASCAFELLSVSVALFVRVSEQVMQLSHFKLPRPMHILKHQVQALVQLWDACSLDGLENQVDRYIPDPTNKATMHPIVHKLVSRVQVLIDAHIT